MPFKGRHDRKLHKPQKRDAVAFEFLRIVADRQDDHEICRQHHRFQQLYSLLFVDGNPAGVKALLHEMGFIDNVLRLPLVPTRLTTLQKITTILKELKL